MKIFELKKNEGSEQLLSIAKTYPKSDLQLKAIKEELNKELDEAGYNRLIYVGYLDNEAVAMIQLILNSADNDLDLANGSDICHVHNLQVRNDYQKQGIGWEMMDFIEDKAKLIKQKIITLGVDSNNNRAIKMYKNRSYEIFKEVEGRTPDEKGYYMRKNLV